MSAIAGAQLRPVPVRRLLLVGESDEIVTKLRGRLPAGTWVVERVPDNASVLPLVKMRTFDVILTGEHTSGREDLELLRKIRKVQVGVGSVQVNSIVLNHKVSHVQSQS